MVDETMRDEQLFDRPFEVRCGSHGTTSHAEMDDDVQYGDVLYWCTQCGNRIIIHFGEELKPDKSPTGTPNNIEERRIIAVASEDIPAESWIAFGNCRWCNGTGKLKDESTCLRCKGTGKMAYRDKVPQRF